MALPTAFLSSGTWGAASPRIDRADRKGKRRKVNSVQYPWSAGHYLERMTSIDRFPLRWTIRLLTGVIAASCAVPAFAEQGAADAAILTSIGKALQGYSGQARADLLALDAQALSVPDQQFRACMIDRFAPSAPPVSAPDDLPPLARNALSAFRAYWQTALTDAEQREKATSDLRHTLAGLLDAAEDQDLDSLSEQLKVRLRQLGLGSLQGRTGPLREFMLWRTEQIDQVPVTLPEGAARTTVYYLRGFASLGWGDYATCGRRGAGGWTADGALYAVVPRYESLAGEEFRVTFLGHETQHFIDLARWPDLPSWRLEYRAKLVELAQARSTRPRILRKFAEDRSDNPELPHSYANNRVIADVMSLLNVKSEAALQTVPHMDLNAAAIRLLRTDSERLVPAGSD